MRLASNLSMPSPKVESRVMGRQHLYERGSRPGLDRVTTVACLNALGNTPSAMQPSVRARAAGRISSHAAFRKDNGTPSGPGMLDVAPRKASLSSSSLGAAANLAVQSGEAGGLTRRACGPFAPQLHGRPEWLDTPPPLLCLILYAR